MDFVLPRALKRADTIGIVAPSMHIVDEHSVTRGISFIEEMGFRVELGRTVRSRYGNTTGPAEMRADELNAFFERPDIAAIVCLIGGSTAAHLLNLIDYRVVQRCPKIFSGMSDITHLHLAFLSKARLFSLHGIDLTFGFGAPRDDPAFSYNTELFLKCCMSPEPLGEIPALTTWECWREGCAEGRLVGGFLSAISNLACSRYWPRLDPTLLFWETTNSDLDDLQIRLAGMEANGVFKNVTGMLVGKLLPFQDSETERLSSDIKGTVLEATRNYDFPIVANADFGHGSMNMPLPEGLLARMDAGSLRLELLEPMVR